MSFVDRWVYLKICFSRAYEHVYIPIIVVQNTLLLLVLLRSYGLNKDWVAIPIILIGCSTLLFVGHLDMKHGIYSKETSIRNKHNPEIKKILEEKKQ